MMNILNLFKPKLKINVSYRNTRKGVVRTKSVTVSKLTRDRNIYKIVLDNWDEVIVEVEK